MQRADSAVSGRTPRLSYGDARTVCWRWRETVQKQVRGAWQRRAPGALRRGGPWSWRLPDFRGPDEGSAVLTEDGPEGTGDRLRGLCIQPKDRQVPFPQALRASSRKPSLIFWSGTHRSIIPPSVPACPVLLTPGLHRTPMCYTGRFCRPQAGLPLSPDPPPPTGCDILNLLPWMSPAGPRTGPCAFVTQL